MSSVAAGWYPSPEDPTQVRYWDGVQWTQHSAPAAAPATAPTAPTGPPAPTAPVYAAPGAFTSPVPPAPTGAPASAAPASAQKKWLIGGAIAAGVIVVGSVGAAIGAGGSDRDGAPQASAAPAVVQTEEPVEEPTPTPTPTPTATPTAAPAPTPDVPVIDAVGFRAQAGSHLDDMNKDLDDIIITVNEQGFWRLLSNSGELAFNLGQLQGLEVPANVSTTWPESLTSLEATLDVLSDAVSTQDGATILAAVDTVRAQVEATRGVANSAL